MEQYSEKQRQVERAYDLKMTASYRSHEQVQLALNHIGELKKLGLQNGNYHSDDIPYTDDKLLLQA